MSIYLDDRDRRHFLELLAAVVSKFQVESHAYCMMTNHYHLVITTKEPNLSAAMRDLNGEYAQWWDRRHERVGHVFQGRFGAKIVQDDVYLLTVCKYVVLNPVRRQLVKSAREWPWSSYGASAGFEPVPAFLHPQTLWRLLGQEGFEASVLGYRKYVAMAVDEAEELMKLPIIGDPEFAERFDQFRKQASQEVPLRERRTRPALETLFARSVTRAERNARAAAARVAGYSQREIAAYLGFDRSTVAKMIVAAERGSGVKNAALPDLTPVGVKKGAETDLTPGE